MKRGDAATACARFRESQKLDPAPGTLVNLSECEEAQGHALAAWRHAVDALKGLAAGDDRIPLVKQRLSTLQHKLARLTIALPEGESVDTLRVTRDGVELAPGELRVAEAAEPGSHVIVASRRSGEEVFRRDIALAPGESRSVTIEMPEAPAPGVVSRPSSRALALSAHSPDDEPTSGQRIAGYMMLGAGSLVAGSGLYLWVQGRSKRDEALALCPAGQAFACPRAQDANDLLDQSESQRRLGAGVGLAGVALQITGLVLALTSPSSQRRLTTWHVGPTWTAFGGGATAGGAW